MKNISLLITIFFLSFNGLAQERQIYAGTTFLGLDHPNNTGLRAMVGYGRFLRNDRFKYTINTSFLNWRVNNWEGITGAELIDKRIRYFTDFNFSFAPIKYRNNYFRIGVGPSVMYMYDDAITYVKFTLEYDATKTVLNTLKHVSHERTITKGFKLGINTMGGFEVGINDRLSLLSDFSLIFIDRDIISAINAGVGYKF